MRTSKIYKTLISEHYEEPVDGKFTDATAAILGMASTDDESNTDTEEEDAVPTYMISC